MELWIARDKKGCLMVSENKPKLWDNKEEFVVDDGEYMILPEEEFPEVSFSNSPQRIKLGINPKDKYKERLLGSTSKLQSDIEECIDNLLEVRKYHNDERVVFSEMERLMISAQQQIDCLIDYIKK